MSYTLTLFLLMGTAAFLGNRNAHEFIAPRSPFGTLPLQIGQWEGADREIPPEIAQALGNGDFLSRTYSRTTPEAGAVDLFLAYFPSQRAGQTLHSPKNCLPGSGWQALDSSHIEIASGGQRSFQANRYIVAQGSDRKMVVYWYRSHGRSIASEYQAKIYSVVDSIRLNRSDGALIRVMTTVQADEPAESCERRILDFVMRLDPLLSPFVPM